jgi:hypothetical protein
MPASAPKQQPYRCLNDWQHTCGLVWYEVLWTGLPAEWYRVLYAESHRSDHQHPVRELHPSFDAVADVNVDGDVGAERHSD